MKNVHLLPTEKPSRLYKSKITQNISMGPIDISQHGDATYNLIIYITSDEEIKVNEYYLGEDSNIYCLVSGVNYNGKKIILTTDQDLIADGVQAIDDEFLEWFVKNPSCEFVEIRKYHSGILSDISEITSSLKIIIPQEEPKQETFEESVNAFKKTDVYINYIKQKQGRMYSEEDLLSAFEAGMMFIGEDKGSFGEWFEQFKKK
jgi:hypothetical protein